jgi:hypothetical protein
MLSDQKPDLHALALSLSRDWLPNRDRYRAATANYRAPTVRERSV